MVNYGVVPLRKPMSVCSSSHYHLCLVSLLLTLDDLEILYVV